MPSRIKCPQCDNAYAYSPALLGKTVRCRQCQHQFTITAPPPEESPAPAAAPPAPSPSAAAPSGRAPAPASKPAPPPLPPTAKASKPADTDSKSSGKGGKSGGPRRRDEDEDDDRPRVGDRDRDDDRPSRRRQPDEDDDDRPRGRDRGEDEDENEDDRGSRRKSDRSGRRPAPAPERESSPLLLIGLIAAFVLGFLILAAGIGYLLWPSSTPSSSQAPTDPVVASDPMAAADRPKALDEILKDAPNRKAVEAGPPTPDLPNFEVPRVDVPRAKRGPRAGGPAPPAVNPPPEVDLPPFEPPPFPGGPPGRRKPDLPAPRLLPVEPLPITPTPMGTDRVERTMPGPIDRIVVAGGGRLLLLHLRQERRVAVLDVSKGEQVKLIPAEDPAAVVAGGLNLFVIYLPAKGVLERWSCTTLQREAELTARLGVEVRALAMGSGSNGPLVAALGGDRRTPHSGATLGYFDPTTGKEIGYEIIGTRNGFGLGILGGNPILRVSSDGSVVTAWGDNGLGGTQSDVLEGGRITRHWQPRWLDAVVPGPDGRTLYGRGERFPPDLKGGRVPRDDPRNPVWLMPAVHGEFFVSLRGSAVGGGNPLQPRKAVAEVCLGEDGKSILNLGELPNFELPSGFGEARGKTIDQYVALVPDAKVLAFVPTKARERLVLRRVDIDSGLTRAGFDYLFVTSRPPTAAVKGETYKYAVAAKSKKGGIKVTLESGPKGMTVAPAGEVTWNVPKDLTDPEAGVVLKVTDAGGKEVFHSFRLLIRARDETASARKDK